MIPASVMTHLPALQIIIPLMAAPISLLLWRPALAAGLTFCVTLTCLAISALLLSQVIDGTVISYHLGGWSPPWGIEYRIDAANAFVLLIVSAIGAVVSPYAWRSAKSSSCFARASNCAFSS